MLNRRSFVGVLIAGVPGLMLAPTLSLSASNILPTEVTATLRLHFSDGSVFEFRDLPARALTADGMNYDLDKCVMVASSHCRIVGITSEWDFPSLGLRKNINHDFRNGGSVGLPIYLRRDDSITLECDNFRFV